MFGLVPFKINKERDIFNNLFENYFNDEMKMNNLLKADVKENKECYIVEADLPGMKKEDINIEYKQNYLTISAHRNNEKEDSKEKYIRKERNYGEVSRSFYVGNIDKEAIKAKFKDGVLEITLQKNEKVVDENNKIEIQ